ncbi:MAG: hypothetical protein RQ982_00570, partial [Gammaproteobacteria bacterium]|nr:hypothetical protein [Gammaproteobacteria bacterium]
EQYITSLQRVLELGVDGLKFHPLHVVKGTQLANEWRRGEYQPLTMDEYVSDVVELINLTPAEVIFHRLTGTASSDVLLAPDWCSKKWQVLNAITAALAKQVRGVDLSRSKSSFLPVSDDLAFCHG